MLDCIARLIAPLLRLLWPAVGRHRAPLITAAPTMPIAATALPAVAPSIGAVRAVPCTDEAPLVRPYVVTHEQREEARRQRSRRRALWLALHGVDIGPRLIHGVEVTT